MIGFSEEKKPAFEGFSMKQLKKKEAVPVSNHSDDEDFEDMPFLPRKKPAKKPDDEILTAFMGQPAEAPKPKD
jgi:hypothetical protein